MQRIKKLPTLKIKSPAIFVCKIKKMIPAANYAVKTTNCDNIILKRLKNAA